MAVVLKPIREYNIFSGCCCWVFFSGEKFGEFCLQNNKKKIFLIFIRKRRNKIHKRNTKKKRTRVGRIGYRSENIKKKQTIL